MRKTSATVAISKVTDAHIGVKIKEGAIDARKVSWV